MKISVVIPIYNVEEYLRECINSVLCQTYKNLEIILVDDGSPDNCPQICDEYSKNDNRIIVVHKENGGLSSARNEGIKIATGEYIIFLDSDDYWENEFYIENIIKCLNHYNKPDVIVNNNAELLNNKITYDFKFDCEYINNEDNILPYLIDNKIFVFGACDKCIKLNIIKDNNIYFKEKIYSEDINWFLGLIPYLSSVKVTNDSIFVYRMRENSITHSLSSKNIDSLLLSIKEYLAKYENINSISTELKNTMLNYFSYLYCMILGLLWKINDKNKNEYFIILNQYKYLLKYSNTKKTKLVSLILKIFGIKIGSYILFKYIENKK